MSALPTSFYWLCAIGGVSWILFLISILNWKNTQQEKVESQRWVIEAHEESYGKWREEYDAYCDLLGRSQFWGCAMMISGVVAVMCTIVDMMTFFINP